MDNENLNEAKLQELLERNLELTEEIYKMTKSMKHYINFQKVMGVIYFLIIVVPIVLGAIYLPPLLKDMMGQYQSILGGETGLSGSDFLRTTNPSDFRNLLSE